LPAREGAALAGEGLVQERLKTVVGLAERFKVGNADTPHLCQSVRKSVLPLYGRLWKSQGFDLVAKTLPTAQFQNLRAQLADLAGD
jgi:hypothetical protein